jgi:cytidylate kinase
MDAPVVTLFEAYGAGAAQIGPRVAAELGVPWIGQSLSSEQLEAADTRASGSGLVTSILTAISGPQQSRYRSAEDARLAQDLTLQVKDAIAPAGGVVLGRNATAILGGDPTVLHVKLDGDVDDRIARAAQESRISAEQARARLIREDRSRAEISLQVFGWDPRQTARFDLVLNTSTFGIDQSVAMIVAAFRHKQSVAHEATTWLDRS